MRDFLRRVGGENAVSLPAWLILLPISMIGTIAITPEPLLVNEFGFSLFLPGLVGHFVVGAVLLVAWLTYLHPRERKPRPFLALSTFLVAGAIRGLAVSFAYEELGLVASADLAWRIVSGAITALTWWTIAAVVVAASREYLFSARQLKAELSRLDALRQELSQDVASIRERLIEQIRKTLEGSLRGAKSKDELLEIAEEVIRPLAGALREPNFDGEAPKGQARLQLRAVVGRGLADFPFPLWPSLIFLALSSGPVRFWANGLAGLLDLALALVSLFLLFSLARLLRLRGPVVIPVLILFGAAIALQSSLLMQALGAPNPNSAAALSFNLWIPALASSFFLAFEAERNKTLSALESALSATSSVTNRLRQQKWVESKRLSRFVHSEIQARIRTSAILGVGSTASGIEKLRTQCLEALTPDSSVLDVARFIEETTELWADVLDLGFEVDPVAAQLMHHDQVCAEAVFEIIREALVNAEKHGQGEICQVSIVGRNESPSVLTVAVKNRGSLSQVLTPGLGFTAFDELCLDWALSGEGGVIEFRGTVATK